MASSVQFWYKGTFTDNQIFVSLYDPSIVDNLYFTRSGNDIKAKTTHSGVEVTFSGIISSLNTTDWIFMGMSVGWLSTGTNFMLWAYIYQQTPGYEHGDWSSSFTISSTYITNGKTIQYKFGPGLSGSLKEVYTTNH